MADQFNAELNQRVSSRIDKIHDLIIAYQLRGEKDFPSSPVVRQGRQFIKSNFALTLPAFQQPATFHPPDVSTNPFAQLDLGDLDSDSDDPADRIAEINEQLNRPGLTNRQRLDLLKEARQLRAHLSQ